MTANPTLETRPVVAATADLVTGAMAGRDGSPGAPGQRVSH